MMLIGNIVDVDWKSISEIIKQQIILDVHKAIQRVSVPAFHDFFKLHNHGRALEEIAAPLLFRE